MFRSLWFRLTGTVVLVVVVTMIIALVASLVIMQREFVNFVNSAVETLQGEPLEITVPDAQGGALDPDVAEGLEAARNALRWTAPGPIPDEVQRRLTDLLDRQDFPAIDVQVPQTVQDDAGLFLETMTNTLLMAIGISAGLALLASTWLFWGITRPLSKLRTATEAVAAGDLGARAPVKRRDEVGRVAEAFNDMADELERQVGLRKQMVADVAHELRTPLSVMRGNLEAMIDDLIPASEDELDAVHQEVMRLSRLVEDLRLLSLADAGELRLEIQEVDAAELVETAVRRMGPSAEAKGVGLVGDIGESTGTIMGDEGKLQQVLANLIANALRYTPAGKKVTVSSQAVDQEVWLAVTDQGPGVDPADLPNFFERFWKGDRARVRSQASSSGSGLGLSIVRQIVELHGGRAEATLPEEGGLQVTVILPVAGPQSTPETRS